MSLPNRIAVCALILFAMLFTAPALNASVISMDVAVTAEVSGDTLRCGVKAINRGDEDARDVRAEADILGEIVKGQATASLPPNEIYSSEFNIPLALKVPGKYPIVITVRFSDANGRPFSSVTCSAFNWKEETSSGVFGEIRNVVISNKSMLRLTLSNMDEKKHDLGIKIVSPREFTVRPPERRFSLAGRQSGRLGFAVDNFSALPGSSSPVFAACEYEEDGKHYLAILNGMILVVEKPVLGKLGEPAIFVLLLTLVAAFIILQFKRLLRSNASSGA